MPTHIHVAVFCRKTGNYFPFQKVNGEVQMGWFSIWIMIICLL